MRRDVAVWSTELDSASGEAMFATRDKAGLEAGCKPALRQFIAPDLESSPDAS